MGVPSAASRMLAGFRSRWSKPRECAWSSPSARRATIQTAACTAVASRRNWRDGWWGASPGARAGARREGIAPPRMIRLRNERKPKARAEPRQEDGRGGGRSASFATETGAGGAPAERLDGGGVDAGRRNSLAAAGWY